MSHDSIDTCLQQFDNNVVLCMQFLREYIVKKDFNITTSCKYGMPFFSYKQKMCCYLWFDKKSKKPYIGIVDGHQIHHPLLIKGNRVKMKILLIDPDKDLPLEIVDDILMQMIKLHDRPIK